MQSPGCSYSPCYDWKDCNIPESNSLEIGVIHLRHQNSLLIYQDLRTTFLTCEKDLNSAFKLFSKAEEVVSEISTNINVVNQRLRWNLLWANAWMWHKNGSERKSDAFETSVIQPGEMNSITRTFIREEFDFCSYVLNWVQPPFAFDC